MSWFAACVLAQAMASPQGVVLVLPLEARSPSLGDSADLITTVVASEIRKQSHLTVVTLRDREDSLTPDLKARAAGCVSPGCASELGGALGAEQVVVGTVGAVGSNLVLTLTRASTGSADVMGASTRVIKSTDPAAVLDQVPAAVAELLHTPPPGRSAAPSPLPRPNTLSPDHVELDRYMVPLQGPAHTEMSWPDFYALVGHPELATAYLGRVTTRVGLRVGGVLVMVAAAFVAPVAALGATGVILGWVFLAPRFVPTGSPAGSLGTALSGGLLGAGLILLGVLGAAGGMVGGLAMIYGAYGLGEQPVTDEEIRTLAEEHNRTVDTPAP
jgi:hypothetical protein